MSPATATTVADPKLIHLVGKLLSNSTIYPNDIQYDDHEYFINTLVQQLQTQHREYQRKNVLQLTKDVSFVVSYLKQRKAQTKTNSKKRKQSSKTMTKADTILSDNDTDDNESNDQKNLKDKLNHVDIEEEEYEREAMIRDSLSTSNSLNNRLLQIRHPQQHLSADINSKAKPSSESKNISDTRYRVDVADSQDEISESFADNDNCNDNTEHNKDLTPIAIKETNDLELATASNVKIQHKSRKRRVVRRSSTKDRIEGNDGIGMNEMSSSAATLSLTTPVPRPCERYSDLGGMESIVTTIRQLVEYPIIRPELYRHLGVDPPRGVLLRGPPGT
jgi:ATP-dependent 26S proteasome regulatory subunit